ncbi:ABC transporter permease [Actinoplanes derwentensis]|uniref:ABC-type nitrate/sulfonate/bicarbonate transport system, permease component n=1 Tax=Actinoplanes derwentensis TaxID=113562 RepID=A0A1H2CF55_9ACTN|nr:ABC transporter permease subunit [Actinoplanes derwentensis]GID86083.1 ABC transporter permease [Actinoplanes derwentensis]SDT69130.1 ABC-type nitrate/sulfonate/bicarbonate transport system, permease component [Actinoplanes derwentensis]
MRQRWYGVAGIAGLLAVWEVVGRTAGVESRTVPPPTAILRQLGTDGFAFYWPNVETTLREAGLGWLWGNAIAVVLAVLFVQIPLLERALLQLALVSYCLPVIAIGPVMAVLFSDDTPKVILAAISVVFTTLVGALVGLRSADRTSLDLVRAYGGGRWTELWRVRLRASLPSLFAGLRIAAPAAMLGAIIGEYLGAESGLGVAMINSQQSLAVERTWGIALVATALSGAAYGLTALVGRLLTPWAPRTAR